MTVRYIGQRLLEVLLVLWLAATLAFGALQWAPGDPAQVLLAASGASPQEVAALRQRLGLDDPPLQQYLRYLLDLVRGDLGRSWLHGRPVGRMIAEQFPSTAALALAATSIGVLLGVSLGTLAAIRRTTWLDKAITALAVLGLSTPIYWSGLLAILLFSLTLRWLPATGEGTWRHLLLPALTLGITLSGAIARVVRVRVGEALSQPYVTAARARGLPPLWVLVVHVLRVALGPAVAVTALQFGFLLGGAVVTESVFARRGLGRLLLGAIVSRDMPVVRGVVLVGALSYVLVNLLGDAVQAWLDPRLRDRAP